MHIDITMAGCVHVHMGYRDLVERYLRNAEAHSGKKISALAKEVAISHTTFTRFLANDEYKYVPKIDKLMKIAEVSGLPLPRELSGSSAIAIPEISWVAAGALAEPSNQIPAGEKTVEIGDLGSGEFFATRVRGDSMDRIAPEDALLIVNRADIALARGGRYIFTLKGETTFKRYGEDPPHLAPESMNPTHQPKILKPTDGWSVIGRVRKVIIDV